MHDVDFEVTVNFNSYAYSLCVALYSLLLALYGYYFNWYLIFSLLHELERQPKFSITELFDATGRMDLTYCISGLV